VRRRWSVISRLAAAAAVAGALMLAVPVRLAIADGTKPVHPRVAIFGGADGRRLVDELSGRSRLEVLFHPEIGRCEPQQIATARALRRLLDERSDIEILTVLPAPPEGRSQIQSLFGEVLPGRVVLLPGPSYLSEGKISPRPRLEVWSRNGHLLLLRSIPPSASEDSIYQEVLWSLAFTEPVE
jgi:hypothetical protein